MPPDCGQSFQSLCFRADLSGVASVSFTNLCVLSEKKLECWSFFFFFFFWIKFGKGLLKWI